MTSRRSWGAVGHAQAMGATVLEGYPVDPGGGRIDQTSGYVGTVQLFEAHGFRRGCRLDQNQCTSGWPLCHHTRITCPTMLEPSIGPQYRLSHESDRLSPSM
jgi:hypothetical protein